MIEQARWVVDTHLLISRLLTPGGVVAQAVDRATERGILLVSDNTLQELTEVLERPRFLALLSGVARRVHITQQFQACRDPKDDKFLDVAFSGQAKAILTGDQDLLVLQTFQDLAILTPALFLAVYAG